MQKQSKHAVTCLKGHLNHIWFIQEKTIASQNIQNEPLKTQAIFTTIEVFRTIQQNRLAAQAVRPHHGLPSKASDESLGVEKKAKKAQCAQGKQQHYSQQEQEQELEHVHNQKNSI